MNDNNKLENHQILNLYFLLMKEYKETKFANDGKHKITFLQINALLEVYYDKVIKDKLHFIDKWKLEMFFKDVINADLEQYLHIEQKEREENINKEKIVSIIEDISREFPEQGKSVNSHELYERLEENSIIEIVNNKSKEKKTKHTNQIYLPFDKPITKVNEELPRPEANVNNIENLSKENSFQRTGIENLKNNLQYEKIKQKKTKWKNLPQRFKYPFSPEIGNEPVSKNYYIFSPSTKLLTQTQLNNIKETLQKSFEQIEKPLGNLNHTSLINNETGLNLPRHLTQSQNFSQIRTIENIISSNSNTRFLENTNSLNLDVPRPPIMNKYSDMFLDLPSNIVRELETPLAIESAENHRNVNELAVEDLAISMQHLNTSIQVPNLEINNPVCQNEIMDFNTEIVLPNTFETIPTKSFYGIRTPNSKPPETYQNWLNYLENNRPIYYESPEKNKRKRRKKKNNAINENGDTSWNQIESNMKQIDSYQELTKFQNFEKLVLESSPIKFCKLTKFDKSFFYSIQLSDISGVFNDCSDIAKTVVLQKATENKNNSKSQRLSDSEILEILNQADMDISKIGLDVKTHLLNLKQKSQFVGAILKNLDIYKIKNTTNVSEL